MKYNKSHLRKPSDAGEMKKKNESDSWLRRWEKQSELASEDE